MMQTSLQERVNYLKRVIAESRERQRSLYAVRNIQIAHSPNWLFYNREASNIGDVIREAERDILRLKAAN